MNVTVTLVQPPVGSVGAPELSFLERCLADTQSRKTAPRLSFPKMIRGSFGTTGSHTTIGSHK
jgi:hypothetical protein